MIYYNYYKYNENENDNILTYIQNKYNENIKKHKDIFGSIVARHDRDGQRTQYIMNYLNMVILKLPEHIVKIPNQLVIHIIIK